MRCCCSGPAARDGISSRSLMVAALFALHPINVESVAWISERKNLLSMLFFLLALAAYRWYAREPRVGRYTTVASLFALGLMAKPQIITLPLVLLLWDYWPLRRMFTDGDSAASDTGVIPARSLSWLVLEKLPLLVLVGASAVITLHAQRLAATPYPLSVRFANALVSYVWYVKKAFWPSHLALLYPHPPGLPPIWPNGSGGSLLARSYRAGDCEASPALFAGGLVVVPGNVSTDDRPGAGGPAGDG